METTQTATETAVLECSFFGREAAFHHIGIAVHSIRAIRPSSEPTANELEGVSMAFLRLNGITIELLEPLGGVITDPGQLTEWDQASPHLLRSSGTDGGRRPVQAGRVSPSRNSKAVAGVRRQAGCLGIQQAIRAVRVARTK